MHSMLTWRFLVKKNVPYKTTAVMQNTRAIPISIIKPLLDLPKALILCKWNTYFREYYMKEVTSYEKRLHHRSRQKEQDVYVPWIMKQICNLFLDLYYHFLLGRHDIHWFYGLLYILLFYEKDRVPCVIVWLLSLLLLYS